MKNWIGYIAALALTPVAAGPGLVNAQPYELNDISLSESYPREVLQSILLTGENWPPFPSIDERSGWEALPEDIRAAAAETGEEALRDEFPALPFTLFMEFYRNGNRSRYQNGFFERRRQLHALVLAECVENGGRFLDAIANRIWGICEETTWCVPAHSRGVPEADDPVVALFSAETAASLAWTHYLLGERLDAVTPQLRERIRREIGKRILTEYLEDDGYGWMALDADENSRRPNNWNPWINSNVIACALLMEPDGERRAAIVHKTLRSLDGFVRPHPADGGCDEGPGYWGHAGGSLFDCLELLYLSSGGRIDEYGHPLIQNIGKFIYRSHIAGDYFVNIGDCNAKVHIYRDLVYRYGKRIGDENMMDLAAHGARKEDGYSASRFIGRALFAMFNWDELRTREADAPPLVRDVWLPGDDTQLICARDRAGTADGLYVACWGAHNGQSHNQNDVGNVIVFADGHPVLIDAGRPEYTRQTFSGRRYEIWAMQSAYHNLPTVNGVQQEAGRNFAADAVEYRADNGMARISMDIAGAYPKEAGLREWKRTVTLNRGEAVEIRDQYTLESPSSNVEMNFLTPLEAVTSGEGKLTLTGGGGPAVEFAYPAELECVIEPIVLEDGGLIDDWGETLFRIVLRPAGAAAENDFAFTLKIQ